MRVIDVLVLALVLAFAAIILIPSCVVLGPGGH
jgi:hypothetical protein